MKALVHVALLLTFTLDPVVSRAQWHGANAPDSLSFQGFLTDDSDVPIDDAVDMTFKLYKGPNEIWSQTKTNVVVSNGVFNVILGGTGLTSLDTVAFNEQIELGIAIEGSAEMAPRTPLTSAAYALGMRGMYAVQSTSGPPGDKGMNVIGGASNNYVADGITGATISGGGGWSDVPPVGRPDSVLGRWGTVGGGQSNTAGQLATVGGGNHNRAIGNVSSVGGGTANAASGAYSSIGGGWINSASADRATVGGGDSNEASNDWATVGGGAENLAGGTYATIGGGRLNEASGTTSTIGGGLGNATGSKNTTIGGGSNNIASHSWSTVSGGADNTAGASSATVGGGSFNVASGENATIGGGNGNVASGDYATIPGGISNSAPRGFTLAAGFRAKANHSGTFVWADSTNADFASTDENQFLIRASGGVGIGTNAPSAPLDVKGGNWDFSVSEGDVRIGSSMQRLKIGIATGGGGAGIARLNAVGTVPRIYLGTNNTDIVAVSPTAFSPNTSDATSLGSSTNVWTEVWATDGAINTSDRRLKQDIRAIGYGLEEVLRLQPVVYQWISHPEKGGKLGLIAQDVDSVIPEVVRHGATPDEMMGINYAELVPVLIKAIQEQQETIEAQSRRLAVLEARMTN